MRTLRKVGSLAGSSGYLCVGKALLIAIGIFSRECQFVRIFCAAILHIRCEIECLWRLPAESVLLELRANWVVR